MTVPEPNPLLSTQKTSDSGIQVALHPLTLLTISDYITRHTLRQQTGPIIGALLGQQNGRDISIEIAFECKCEVSERGDVLVSQAAFDERLQQCKVHSRQFTRNLVLQLLIFPILYRQGRLQGSSS
jgi:COP9 signalosome complex subunit 6